MNKFLKMQKLSKSLIFFFLGMYSSLSLFGQQLNTPKEFRDIMKYSPIQYFNLEGTNTSTFEVLKTPSFEGTVSKINGTRLLEKAIKKGNKYYQKKKWDKALHCYEKALEVDKNNVWILRRMGELFVIKKEYEKAIEYLDKTLIVNKYDFESLSLKAESQAGLKNFGVATRTITLAHLYNRNDVKIRQQLIRIAALDSYEYDNSWQFDFNFDIKEIGQDSIQIIAPHEIWKAYGNCKAVWVFDANYKRAKQNDFPKRIDFVEEKECLLNFMITYEMVDIKYRNLVKPLAPKIAETIDKKLINAFILYEIWAVQNPKIMHKITKEELDDLMMYMFTIRTKLVIND